MEIISLEISVSVEFVYDLLTILVSLINCLLRREFRNDIVINDICYKR